MDICLSPATLKAHTTWTVVSPVWTYSHKEAMLHFSVHISIFFVLSVVIRGDIISTSDQEKGMFCSQYDTTNLRKFAVSLFQQMCYFSHCFCSCFLLLLLLLLLLFFVFLFFFFFAAVVVVFFVPKNEFYISKFFSSVSSSRFLCLLFISFHHFYFFLSPLVVSPRFGFLIFRCVCNGYRVFDCFRSDCRTA